MLLAVGGVVIAVGGGAGLGASTSRRGLPERAVGLRDPGGLRLVLSVTTATPGETLDFRIEGDGLDEWFGAIGSDLEVLEQGEWRRVYVLQLPLLNGQPTSYPLPMPAGIASHFVAFGADPGRLRLPESLPPGDYRIRRDMVTASPESLQLDMQSRTVSLYAPIRVN